MNIISNIKFFKFVKVWVECIDKCKIKILNLFNVLVIIRKMLWFGDNCFLFLKNFINYFYFGFEFFKKCLVKINIWSKKWF